MPTATGDHDPEQLSEIKSVLRSLLISNSKVDVTIPRLNGLYREEEGENIPFRKFGYQTVQEFLRSMPDVVCLQYNSREHQLCAYHIDTEKSAHVSSLVSRQRKPQKRAKYVSYKPHNPHYGNSSYNYSRPPSQQNTMSTLNTLRIVLEELRREPKYFQNHSTTNGIRKSDILHKFKERSKSNSINSIPTLNTKLKELGQYLVIEEDFVHFKEDIFKSHDSAQKTAPSKSAYQNLNVRSAPILKETIQKVETSQQANVYPPPFSQPTRLERIDGPPATQINQIHVSTYQGQKLPPADVPKAHKQSHISYENEVMDRIKFRLQKLIEKCPEGIWAAQLPTMYKQEYKLDLDYYELGYDSITQFVSTMSDILRIIDPDNTGRHMILDAKIPLDKVENKQQTKTQASLYNFDDFVTNNQEPVPNKLSTRVSKKLIPEGMMGFDETVEYIEVGTLAALDYFEVNISEIFTPSFFWITMRKNKSKIKKLMDDLDEFYKLQDLDYYRLPQVLIETGLNVACIYAKMWHRAMVKKVKADGYVVVLFYDYGTVKTYNPNDLYYLHKRFSALPAQALACGLHNVKTPQGNEWPILSTNKFVNKVWGIPLMAIVCETNEDNNTMTITLTDTNDDAVDLHLDEWMIHNGLAVRGKMENTPSTRYQVPTHGVPLDKLCMYDEDVLRKRDKDYEKSLKTKEQDETQNYHEYIPIQQPDLKVIDSASNYISDSSFDVSNIANLVRENRDLTKQTNTLAQAILSIVPINKPEIPKPSSETPSSCSQEINKISSDLKKNLSNITGNFSKIINEPCADVFKTGSMYLEQNRNSNRGSSLVSLNSSNSEYTNPRKPTSNELSDHCTSNQSRYSRQSNSDKSQSANPSENQNGHIQEYDKAIFTDGTPTIYSIKQGNNYSERNQIPLKYPPGFANSMISQSQMNNNNNDIINGNVVHEKSNYIKGSDDGYQTIKFASSTQTSIVPSSTSMNSKSSSRFYTPIELSYRCCRKTLHIFHLDGEGWISVNEFIDSFTNLKLDKIMFKFLESFNIHVEYKHLKRVDNPQLFSQLDQTKIKASRESNGKIKSDFVLNLLPIKSMLHVLAKLDFLDPKTLKEASNLMKQHKEDAEEIVFEQFKNKILYDALNVLIQYREFRRFLLAGK